MKVILRNDMQDLGKRGDIVDVDRRRRVVGALARGGDARATRSSSRRDDDALDARVDEGSKGDHRSAARRCVTRDAATSAEDANDG